MISSVALPIVDNPWKKLLDNLACQNSVGTLPTNLDKSIQNEIRRPHQLKLHLRFLTIFWALTQNVLHSTQNSLRYVLHILRSSNPTVLVHLVPHSHQFCGGIQGFSPYRSLNRLTRRLASAFMRSFECDKTMKSLKPVTVSYRLKTAFPTNHVEL